jgi:hypothetical protein
MLPAVPRGGETPPLTLLGGRGPPSDDDVEPEDADAVPEKDDEEDEEDDEEEDDEDDEEEGDVGALLGDGAAHEPSSRCRARRHPAPKP